MNRRISLPIILLILAAMACTIPGLGAKSTDAPKPDERPTAVTSKATTPAKPATAPGAITSVKDASKAVVRIVVNGAFEDPEYGKFEGGGSGTGFIIDSKGLAITNNHVVTGAATVEVFFYGDSEPRGAKVLGASECSDLALIDIDGEGYPYFEWFEGSIERGMKVTALGYPLGDPEITQTEGTINKSKTTLMTDWAAVTVDAVVEHSARINPGNSGGPLLSESGKVVGVNYASSSKYTTYFAITKSEVMSMLEDLKAGKDVYSLGINGLAFVTDDQKLSGIWVYSVKSGSPADKAEIKAGDIIFEIENIQVAKDGTKEQYCKILHGKNDLTKDTLNVKVIRYKTKQILEGQINGRKLAVTSSGSGTTAGGTTGGGTTTTAGGYFTEEFAAGSGNWKWFNLGKGDPENMKLATADGKLTFNLNGTNLWIYMVYQNAELADVRVDAVVTKRPGTTNDNNISLICRYSDDGWYEVNFTTSGLWNLLLFDNLTSKNYKFLANGGSDEALRCKDKTCTYSLICKGNRIEFGVNNIRPPTGIVTNNIISKAGKVGISASSFGQYPVIIDYEKVTTTKP